MCVPQIVVAHARTFSTPKASYFSSCDKPCSSSLVTSRYWAWNGYTILLGPLESPIQYMTTLLK